MDKTDIARKIIELRNERKLTQTELATALGISVSNIGMYETGKRIPRDEVKISMAKFFGVDVSYIFYPK